MDTSMAKSVIFALLLKTKFLGCCQEIGILNGSNLVIPVTHTCDKSLKAHYCSSSLPNMHEPIVSTSSLQLILKKDLYVLVKAPIPTLK